MNDIRKVLRTALALLRRPALWSAAIALALRLVPNQWWRRGPLPPREYLEYRANAVYGCRLVDIPADALIDYLEWCKAYPRPVG